MIFRCKHPFRLLVVEKEHTATRKDVDFETINYHLHCSGCKKNLTLSHARLVGGAYTFLQRRYGVATQPAHKEVGTGTYIEKCDGLTLLPCPFCGSKNIEHKICASTGYMECEDCGCIGPEVTPDHDIEAAEKRWDKRTG